MAITMFDLACEHLGITPHPEITVEERIAFIETLCKKCRFLHEDKIEDIAPHARPIDYFKFTPNKYFLSRLLTKEVVLNLYESNDGRYYIAVNTIKNNNERFTLILELPLRRHIINGSARKRKRRGILLRRKRC